MKLMILDGNSVINRAYFGVRPLTTRDGLYTHAIYGFLNILEKMEKEVMRAMERGMGVALITRRCAFSFLPARVAR